MRVLISGATGYLGTHLALALVEAGHGVTALIRPTSDIARHGLADDRIAIERTSDLRRVHELAAEHDVVLHAATTYRAERTVDLLESNLRLPLALLDGACERPARCFIDVGTCLPRRTNAYALSKAQFAEWCEILAPGAGLAVAHVELQHYYGPDAPPRNFVSFLLNACLRADPYVELTEGWQRRDFVHIDDVVAGFRALLAKLPAAGEVARISLGTGEAISVRELAQLVRDLTGAPTELRFGAVPLRPEEPDLCVADLKAAARLGWRPRVRLRDGLAALVAHARMREA